MSLRVFDVVDEIRNHAIICLKKSIPRPTKRVPWSDEEEKRMTILYGDNWSVIREYMITGVVGDHPESASLDGIFSAGLTFGSSFSEIEDLKIMIANEEIHQEWQLVPTIDHELVPKDLVEHFFSGRTTDHKLLCFSAVVWLLSTGMDFDADTNYEAGVADVISRDRSIAIECGYTKVRKAIEMTRIGKTLAVIPYHQTSGTTDIIFLFSPGPNAKLGSNLDWESTSSKNIMKKK